MNLDKLLKKTQKPSRYTGGEWGSVKKDPSKVSVRFAFCFPDTYEVGMSHLGMRILYHLYNSRDDVYCERVFAPLEDFEQLLRENNMPLFSLETKTPLCDFDMIGFTLQYELCYTNILNILEMGHVAVKSRDRKDGDPFVCAGGPCAYNPEPLADFIDIFSIGEGEEALLELAALLRECKKSGVSRAETLRRAAHLNGFYVPSLYDVGYKADGTLEYFRPKYDDVPATVRKRIITDLDTVTFPRRCPVPFLETVHDRVMLEVFRGCIRGCRFCQAGMIYRPYREKSPETLDADARESVANSGYSEVSLTSLSISDYTRLPQLIEKLLSWTDEKKVNLSLPSMRIDSFYEELLEKVSSVRKSGLTFAPEAGTQRLRDVINKNITEEEILSACRKAFDGGRSGMKLYFMNGLPTETDEDIAGIAALGKRIVDEYYSEKRPGKGVNVTISVSCLVPKPFTPFQWCAQDSIAELERKQQLLRSLITTRKISYKYHDATVSRIEAVFARGDRRLCKALYRAYERGMMLDGWDEYFSYDNWLDVFSETGIDPAFYANRVFGRDELLPWDFIDIGVTKKFLQNEYDKALSGVTTPDCRTKCSGCGAASLCSGKCVCNGREG